jgi:hypothetical protein
MYYIYIEREARLRETNWSSKNGGFADGLEPSQGKQSTQKQRRTALDIGGLNDKRPGMKKEKRLGVHETLNVAARNVRSIGNKESELWKK